MRKTLQEVVRTLGAVDQSIGLELARSHEKVDRALQGFIDKLQDLAQRKAQVSLDRLERLAKFVAPHETAQERICAFSVFWCKYGIRLLEAVEASMAESEGEFIVLSL